MNFEEVQMIWDSQKNEPIFKIDRNAVVRMVDKESVAIDRDLKLLEITAIVLLVALGITTLIDTFFNGEEYFQLFSVAFEFSAAGFLWSRRRKRQHGIPAEPLSLLQRIDVSINQSRTTIQRGRDMATVFSVFVLYGVVVRMLIYGWSGSEIKAFAALVCIVLLWAGMRMAETMTHGPRLKSLGALRQKLLDVPQTSV